MKILMAAVVVVMGCSAQAQQVQKDVLVCNFSNPSFEVQYNANTGEVSYSGVAASDAATSSVQVIAPNAELKEDSKAFGVYSLVDKVSGQVIMALHLGKGRDGTSDYIYPFSAEYKGSIGGCDTSKVSAYSASSLVNGLKR